MWLLVGVCSAFWEQMVRRIANHLIGIALMATDVSRFYAAALVHPQKIPGILVHLGRFPDQRSAVRTSFPKPLINEWPWKIADRIPAPVVLVEQGESYWLRHVGGESCRRRHPLATQLELSHKPKSRALLPHRHSRRGIPGYWVSSRYNLPTTFRSSASLPVYIWRHNCERLWQEGNAPPSAACQTSASLKLNPARNKCTPGLALLASLSFLLSSTEVACAKEAWVKERPRKISVIISGRCSFVGTGPRAGLAISSRSLITPRPCRRWETALLTLSPLCLGSGVEITWLLFVPVMSYPRGWMRVFIFLFHYRRARGKPCWSHDHTQEVRRQSPAPATGRYPSKFFLPADPQHFLLWRLYS